MAQQVSLAFRVVTGPLNFWRRVRLHNLRYAAGWLTYQLRWRWREWRLGTDTQEYAHGVAVGDQGECLGYEPIDFQCFDTIIDHMQPIGPGDGFLDYGCGMGRAVVLAAQHPWGVVVGVELDQRLVTIARKGVAQLERRGLQRAQFVELAQADATRYEVPAQINCIFLFNSFGGSVLQATLAQIKASFKRWPRVIRIAYVQPVIDADPLQGLHWLSLEAELTTGYFPNLRSRVYRTVVTAAPQ